jgi:hypothetical protein
MFLDAFSSKALLVGENNLLIGKVYILGNEQNMVLCFLELMVFTKNINTVK